jgi:isopenicillin N synthase-like dioxygenase
MTASEKFHIPVIDISAARGEDRGARLGAARAFGEALEHVGFVTVVGHGIDEKLLTSTYAAVREFFALPTAEKMHACPPEQAKARGYLPVGIESVAATLDADTPPDLCEALVFAGLARPPSATAKPNIWPQRPERLRDLVLRYNHELDQLGKRLARVSALALDLDEDALDGHFAEPSMTLRFVNYPDQPNAPLPGQLRYGAHHDYGGLTILRQDEAPGGLEVCDADGTWHEVPPSPGGFVINVGDLMSRWTNGRWRSTLHRVVNPPRELTGSTQRLSMVTFYSPNEESEIACLPSCATSTNPPRWPPVKAGEYILAKIAKSMDLPSGPSAPAAPAA